MARGDGVTSSSSIIAKWKRHRFQRPLEVAERAAKHNGLELGERGEPQQISLKTATRTTRSACDYRNLVDRRICIHERYIRSDRSIQNMHLSQSEVHNIFYSFFSSFLFYKISFQCNRKCISYSGHKKL